ncbi:MAG TPA: VWA domain-containing protein, partial [Gemmatimonadaceae bacterium]
MKRALRRVALKARHASATLRERLRPRGPRVVELDRMKRRLELLIAGLYGRAIPIAPLDDGHRRFAARVIDAMTVGRQPVSVLATNDAESIRLPRHLDASESEADAVARYQLLALEQAERVVRGSARLTPAGSPLERDLYHIAEGHAVDAALAARAPRIADTLAGARVVALTRRPKLEVLFLLDRRVEELARYALGGEAPVNTLPLPVGSPEDSLAWARETAASIHRTKDRYLGLTPITLWGAPGVARDVEETPIGRTQKFELGRRLGPRITTKGGEDAERGDRQEHVGISRTQLDDPRRAKADDRGLVTMSAAGAGDGSESGSLESAALPQPGAPLDTSARAIWYPEWDCYARRFRPLGAAVVEPDPAEASGDWAERSLRSHAALVREVKHRFGKLRAQRLRLPHQRAGDELDLGAVVRSLAEIRAGHAADDRLYVEVRPARRGLAIALLVDVSGSTDAPVTDTHHIIDVERDAVLFASEALDALGDRYAVFAFSGRGAEQVRVTTVKGFAEPNGDAVRRRVSGLAPDANTRLGAAVRHVAALLAREPAGHRLLLILSDGKPNDVGHYQGEYAVEDTRQAILEARAQGIFPFCLAVDREEPEYLARIFGSAGHTILRSPDQLP